MGLICHETGEYVENPYPAIQLVLKDPQSARIAYSNLELALCAEVYQRLGSSLEQDPSAIQEKIGYAIQTKVGQRGGFSGNVQLFAPSRPLEDYQYLTEN
mgnify:FL=1